MQVSEEGISETIYEALRPAVPDSFAPAMLAAAWVAAHAIAEKLAEGVVWNREYVLRQDDAVARLYIREGQRPKGRWGGEIFTKDMAHLDGQVVTVTVTREESDG